MIAQFKKNERNATQPCLTLPRRQGSLTAVQARVTKKYL